MDWRAGLRARTLWIIALTGAIAPGCSDDDGDPVITTASLADAEQGQPYSVEIGAKGAGPLTWRVAPNTAVPPGLMLRSAGDQNAVLVGTPTVPGVFRFVVDLVDSRGREASRELSLAVRSSLSLDGLDLPVAVEGRDYEARLSPSGGADAGFAWSVVSGALPPGLVLEDTAERMAVIRGRPAPGTFQFAVEVVDDAGGVGQKQFELQVRSSLALVAAEPPTGRTGRGYAWTLSVEGGLGEGVGWRVLDGALPPGLSFGLPEGRTIDVGGVPVSAGS
ncbi:MAG TPA: putative Ig domain-containing protein, partial [Kofleriaceae bacterium]|nr:putative Ig domain-containing protein [Kofleriaceae bacterium]